MQLIVPMAGLGSRFRTAGYQLPKPLIPVAGVPMVVRAVEALPSSGTIVFVVHPDHCRMFAIDIEIRHSFPLCRIVETSGTTQGQACTVRLGLQQVDPQEPVLVAACDAAHLIDEGRFQQLCQTPGIDCIVWTYRGEPRVLMAPDSLAWLSTEANGIDVTQISCKAPLSNDLLNDHVLSGFFWFRSADIAARAIDQLVARGQTINGEFYLDQVPNLLIREGRRVVAFEVEKYIGWGTPSELEDFHRWQKVWRMFERQPSLP